MTDKDPLPTCDHCGDEIEGTVKVDAGFGGEFCSTDHLLASANEDATPQDDGELVVRVDGFECRYCVETNEPVLSREGGQWVHIACGMGVSEEMAERADEQLAAGNGRDDYTEKIAESVAEGVQGELERLDDGDER